MNDNNIQAILLDDGSLDTVIGIVKNRKLIKEFRYNFEDITENERIELAMEYAISDYYDWIEESQDLRM